MALSYFAAGDLNQQISDLSMTVVLWASVALIVLVGLAMLLNTRYPKLKPLLFGLILLVVTGTTLTISGGTVYLNVNSAAGGPVHWHADFEVWACDNELELRDPRGFLSNKIGSATYHEHNDRRIHLEGVPVTLPHDASLGFFMETVGGGLSKDTLIVPLNDENYFADGKGREDGDGPAKNSPDDLAPFVRTTPEGKVAAFVSGEACGDTPSEVQVFVYEYNEEATTYSQRKLEDPADHAIAKHETVPAGDCVIMEFAPAKERTNKLCKQYGIKDKERCGQFGVPKNRHDICDIQEVE